ncbi:SDR family oxidoreductase [Spirosoma sp. BT702]|uniref:SDR family oxidoreductase n=1 Tax=Spirosoma profusum TaxID=2771354 RepID=A0A927AQC0_9BACT|nr:SDR family oxidoreductase [Spirosoma profusum]MBD2700031.1 SDR family oxidoreductase [Spirosoma profusum]
MRLSTSTKTILWAVAGLASLASIRAALAQKRKFDFRGKTVVITGGSRGLGLELARLFAREGATLALCARQADELTYAQQELENSGGLVFTQVCDITDKTQAERFIQSVRQEVGPIDVLVNNAGVISVSPFEHVTETDFREAMDTHFWGAFHLINAALPQMLERAKRGESSGRIVNIASVGGKISVPHLLPYSASKFTMVGYSEGLRAALQEYGIYVTTICPGLMRTGSPRNATFKGQHRKEYAAFKIADSIPLFTMNSAQAAREIVEACRYGEAERILGGPAKLASAIQGVAPGLLAEIMGFVNTLLPNPGGIGEQPTTGIASETALSSSFLTKLTNEAAKRNNE